jgi:carbon storage regulator
MLVLTRKKSQSILIGNDIKIQILEIKGNYVSIGITAPRDTAIMRSELLDENSDSSNS